ncbi:hypothetical protein M1446_00030 [Candidatus Dependentiae bacterium]|nr:hypothetical protein [Candidatus Dependentiae bacterium]
MKSTHLLKKANSRKRKNSFSYIIGFIFIFLFGFSLYYFWRESRVETNFIIGQHIEKLKNIFDKIDSQAKILGFNQNKFYIDFLNVKNFSGSYIGPMLLAEPQNWAGPYLNDNFNIQEKLYRILKIENDYFIVPDDGVQLSDGKIIGKDIQFASESDINQMLENKILINDQNKPLIAKINLSKNNLYEQLTHIKHIFEQIDKDCQIIGFEHDKNPINFFNVENFVGSEIGAMNLAYPNKWKGPYIEQNPTYQNKFYQVIKTANNEYFIVPGDDVELPNGKVIGKDIIIEKNSDIEKMMEDPQQLFIGCKPAAVKLKLQRQQITIIPVEEGF